MIVFFHNHMELQKWIAVQYNYQYMDITNKVVLRPVVERTKFASLSHRVFAIFIATKM